jgi:hypothetical protein
MVSGGKIVSVWAMVFVKKETNNIRKEIWRIIFTA